MKGTKPASIVESATALVEVPRAPAWLSKEAKAEWRRVLPDLVERRILSPADMGLVEAFCVALGRVREIEGEIRKAGSLDPRLFRMQDKAIVTARQIGAEIGATPVSRSRPTVRAEGVDDEASPLGM